MLIVKGLKVGYDGGGIACGPVEGNTVVEVEFKNEMGKNIYVLGSQFQEFVYLEVRSYPAFDVVINMMSFNKDFDAEREKIKEVIERWDFEESSFEDTIRNSDYKNALYLVRIILWDAFNVVSDSYDADFVESILDVYLDKDVDQLDLKKIVDEYFPNYNLDIEEEDDLFY